MYKINNAIQVHKKWNKKYSTKSVSTQILYLIIGNNNKSVIKVNQRANK